MSVRVLVWLLIVWLWVILVMSITGCGSTAIPATTDLPQVGQGLARIEGDAIDARGHVERAKPHADAIGKTELDGAEFSLDDLLNELALTETAYDRAVGQVFNLTIDYADKSRELEEEQDHWLGFKTRRLLFWITLIGVLSWVGLGIGGMAMKGFGVGWVFTAGQQILRLLPVANPFSAGANKIMEIRGQSSQLPIAAAPVTVNVNVPPPPQLSLMTATEIYAAQQQANNRR